jgi:hypothetical protein
MKHAARVGERRGAHSLLVGNLTQRVHLDDPGIDRRIILKLIFENWDDSMDWIDLAQGRDRWRALENAVMNFRIPQYAGHLLSS